MNPTDLIVGGSVVSLMFAISLFWSKKEKEPKLPGKPVSYKGPGLPVKPGDERKSVASMPRARVPEWAGFFSEAQLAQFLQMVGLFFKASEKKCKLDLAQGMVQTEDGMGYGLGNLAQICKANDQKSWPDIIANHFLSQAKAEKERAELEKPKPNFDAIKNLLHLRLYPEEYAVNYAKIIVSRAFLENTAALLVFDLPASVENVRPEDAAKWGQSEDELFKLAAQNVLQHYPPDISEQPLNSGVKIKLLTGENFIVTTHALFLGRHPGLVGSRGVVFAIPHRHVVLCYPVEGPEVLTAIDNLIPIAMGMFRDGPGSITPNLYWYDQKKSMRRPYKFAANKLEFMPPREFVEMLTSLKK